MKLNHYNATKPYARPVAISLLAAIACALVMLTAGESFSSPQTAPARSMSAALTGKEVYSWARSTQQKLPDLETWNRARTETETDRSLVMLVKRGHAIVNRVIKRGPGMSSKEAASYDAQMRIVVGQLDKLAAGTSAGGVSGCMKGCDGAYKGWGKGKGWKRFWCHVGCIKVKVGSVGVG